MEEKKELNFEERKERRSSFASQAQGAAHHQGSPTSGQRRQSAAVKPKAINEEPSGWI